MIDTKTIETIAERVVDLYRKQLEINNINASGTLSDTASVKVELNGSVIVVSLLLQDYYKFVEDGRPSGGMPPIENIENWIRIKPAIPDSRNGKIPSTRQFAWAIAKNIAKNGIPGRKPLAKMKQTDDFQLVIDAIKDEIKRQLIIYYLTEINAH